MSCAPTTRISFFQLQFFPSDVEICLFIFNSPKPLSVAFFSLSFFRYYWSIYVRWIRFARFEPFIDSILSIPCDLYFFFGIFAHCVFVHIGCVCVKFSFSVCHRQTIAFTIKFECVRLFLVFRFVCSLCPLNASKEREKMCAAVFSYRIPSSSASASLSHRSRVRVISIHPREEDLFSSRFFLSLSQSILMIYAGFVFVCFLRLFCKCNPFAERTSAIQIKNTPKQIESSDKIFIRTDEPHKRANTHTKYLVLCFR